MKNSELSAHPVVAPDHGPIMTGLTKREEFAKAAMIGLATAAFDQALEDDAQSIKSNLSEVIAVYAVNLADELLKALES